MKDKDPKYNLMLIFALIIVLTFDIFFVSHKEGYQNNEILSYELANSEFIQARPMDSPFYDGHVWMSSLEITDRVSFLGDNSLVCLSAYLNSAAEGIPPLYFMLLNASSAIWAIFSYGVVSPWPGCILNMIFMMGSMLVISSFFKNVTGKRFLGPVAALFYGLSPAGIDTVLLTGPDGVVAFFCLASAYLVLKKIADERSFAKRNKKIIFTVAFGMITGYKSCIFFFFLILSAVIYLASAKKKKEAVYLIRTAVISACFGALLYPFVFREIYKAVTGSALSESFDAIGGVPDRIRTLFEITAERTGWSGGGAASMLVFVLLAALIAVLTKNMRFYAPVLFVTVCGYILTVSAVFPLADSRLLMPVFPFVMIIWIMGLGFIIYYIAERFLKDLKFKKMIYTGVLFIWTVSCICLVLVITPSYLYEGYSEQMRIARNYSAYDAVVIYGDEGFYRNIPELMNYGNCLLIREDEVGLYDERLASLKAVVVIEGKGVDKDAVIRSIGNTYGFSSLTFLMEDGVFGDRVCLLSK